MMRSHLVARNWLCHCSLGEPRPLSKTTNYLLPYLGMVGSANRKGTTLLQRVSFKQSDGFMG